MLVAGSVLLGLIAGIASSAGPFWVGWAVFLMLIAGYAIARSTMATLIGVIAIITLFPFGALPFKVAVTPAFLELALIGLLAGWLIRLPTDPDRDLRLSILAPAVLLFLGFTVFSLIIGANGLPDNMTLHNYVKFVLAVGLFFSVLNCVRTRDEMQLVMRALLICGTLSALLAIGLYILNDQTALRFLTALGRFGYPVSGRVLRYINDDPAGTERAIGTAIDPNSFGGMQSLLCALAAGQLWSRRPPFRRSVLVAQAGIMALCVVMTFSRAALGGLVVAILFLATFRERRLWYLIGIASIIAAIVLSISGLGGDFVQRITEGIQFRDQANQMRLAEYRNALQIIGKYPIFGVGFGTGPELGLITGVSSIYLAMGERIGLVGLTTFLVAMVIFFVRTFGAIPQLDEERRSWLLGIQAAIVAALAGGLLDHYYFNIEFSHMVALFWGTIGLGFAILSLDQPQTTSGADDA